LWPGRSLHHSQRADLRCCPSSLHTFRAFARPGSGLASVRSGPLAFPEFEQFYARHFHRGAQSHGLRLLCLPIPPRPLARSSNCIGSQLAPSLLPLQIFHSSQRSTTPCSCSPFSTRPGADVKGCQQILRSAQKHPAHTRARSRSSETLSGLFSAHPLPPSGSQLIADAICSSAPRWKGIDPLSTK
jgi:hypothetical protein